MRNALPPANPLSLPHKRLRASLDFFSSRIPDPVHKLWFIKRTLAVFEEKPDSLKRLPILRGIVFHYIALESLGEIVWSRRPATVELPRGPLWAIYRARHLLLAMTLLAVAYGAYLVGTVGYDKAQSGADWFFAQLIPIPTVVATMAPDVHPDRQTTAPNNVWLVETENDEELWSNGLRVITTFETPGQPRSFFAFPRDGSPPEPRSGNPVGIVYHASQSDMAPFAQQFNRDILTTTRDLVGWLSRREIYNYMIDRFGQVYRIVSDKGISVHAGVSIWGDDEHYYLNLNESFIGIAFESQWNAGRDIITEAQVQAALNLTDVLRAQYRIPDINCVPHGLVSVNKTKRLIGYHADWAKGFPFGALGLDDNYLTPPPSITAFGFRHDEDLVERLGGELWPGVHQAELVLRERAADAQMNVDVLRRDLFRRYEANLGLVH